MVAACGAQVTVEQRWAVGENMNVDWVAKVLGQFDYTFAFGAESNGLNTSWLVTRGYETSTGAPYAAQSWPVTDNAEIRMPCDIAVVRFSIIPTDNYLTHVVVTGTSPGLGGSDDIVTICYNGDLTKQLWMARYSNDSEELAFDDAPVAVYADMDIVTVVGTSGDAANGDDVVVVVYDTDSGDPVYTHRYNSGGAASDVAMDVTRVGSTTYVGASTTTTGGVRSCLFLRYEIAATSQMFLWGTNYGAPGLDYETAAIAMPKVGIDLSCYAAAQVSLAGAPNKDWLTIKVGEDGAVDWQAFLPQNGAGDDRPTDIGAGVRKDHQGGGVYTYRTFVWVTGYTWDSTNGNRFTTAQWEDMGYCSTCYEHQWTHRLDDAFTAGDDRGVALDTEPHRMTDDWPACYVTGRIQNASGDLDMYTMSFDADEPVDPNPKVPRWDIRHAGAGGGHDVPTSIWFEPFVPDGVHASRKSIFVGGSSFGATSGEDWKTIRYVEVPPP